jgi:hypothetical protein
MIETSLNLLMLKLNKELTIYFFEVLLYRDNEDLRILPG